jgi:hypothetical protein
MRYRLRTAVILSVLVTALVPSIVRAAPVRGERPRVACNAKPTQVHAFHVEAEWTKEVYRKSEKAEVTVTVTRPAHEDPADLGLPIDPPASAPVEGATVWTSVITGEYPYPYGYGVTDAMGQVHFKIPLKKLEPGKWDVSHYADKWTNQGGCPDVEEWGYLYESPGFTLTP